MLLRNTASTPFKGMHRTTINPDKCPTHQRGYVNGKKFALGRLISNDSQFIDIELQLAPGESVEIDISKTTADRWNDANRIAIDPISFFGIPKVQYYDSLIPLGLQLPLTIDGNCITAVYSARYSPLLVAKLYLRWQVGQNWGTGVYSITCSNPASPEMNSPLVGELKVEGHQVIFPLAAPNGADWIGDGQTRHYLVGIMFGQTHSNTDYDSCVAQVTREIQGHGVDNVGIKGKAKQCNFNPANWYDRYIHAAYQNLNTYNLFPIGVATASTVTGDQETQGFEQGSESLYPGGIGCEIIRELTGLGQGRQPCHYLRTDGSMMMPEDIPDAMMWQGRPLWINKRNESPSWLLLGKPRQINMTDTHGWYGPDRAHWLIHDIAAGYELTGNEALLDELRHHARNYLWGDTVDPSLSTSGPDSARGIGWTCLVVMHLLKLLPGSDPLRNLVKERALDRMNKVYMPFLKERKFWDYEQAKPQEIANYPQTVFLYQMAVGAFGLYTLASYLRHEGCIEIAVRGAETVVDLAYQTLPNGFTEWEQIGYNADLGIHASWHRALYVEGQNAHRTGWFRHSWLPLALPVVVKDSQDPQLVTKAKALYAALLNEYQSTHSQEPIAADWFPPIDV